MKRILKIFVMVVIEICIYAMFLVVNAASANLNVSSTEVEVGTTVNITVNINAAAWEIHVSGAVKGDYSDTSSDGNNTVKPESLSFTPSAAGTYEVYLNGNVTDGASENGEAINVKDKKIIKVIEKKTEENKPQTQPETPKQADPTFTNTSKTMYTSSGINLRASWSTSSAATGVPAGTELTVTGVSSEKVNGYIWYRVTYNGQTKYVASNLLTSEKPSEEDKNDEKKDEKSVNKALKELIVEGYELSPAFNPDTTKYTISLNDTDKELKITATPEDEKSKVEITGNEDFKVGNNIVRITVTAEDGTARIYSITVSKTSEAGADGLKLSKLEIPNVTLEPAFDPEVTNYIIEVEDPSTIKVSDIVATAEDSDVKITTAEEEATEDGTRVVTIMLESKDGEKTGIYQITIKKPTSIEQTMASNTKVDNSIYYILGGIIAALIVLIIIIIIALKKTSEKDEEDDENTSEISEDSKQQNIEDEYSYRGSNNYKSQILADKLEEQENEGFGETKVNNFDFSELDFNTNKTNELDETDDKRGKHF